ncbi:MAG: LamG-like jellyroll fold domain-containing protein [Phycisphaerae bacterium]
MPGLVAVSLRIAAGVHVEEGPAVATAALVAEYDAANVTPGATTWTDSVGTKNGSFNNPAVVVAGDPSPTGIDGAVVFNGSTTVSLSGGGFNPNPDAATVEIWVKPALDGDGNPLGGVLFETGGSASGLMVGINDALPGSPAADNANSIVAAVGGTASADGKQILSNAPDFSAFDDFIQIVFATGADGSKLYLNGALVASDATVNDSWAGANGAAIGGIGAGNLGAGGNIANTIVPNAQFSGEIGLVRFYSAALSDAEVVDTYNAIVPEPGAVGMIGAGAFGGLVRRKRR